MTEPDWMREAQRNQRAAYEAMKARAPHLTVNVAFDPGSVDHSVLTIVENGTTHGLRLDKDVRRVWFKGQEVFTR